MKKNHAFANAVERNRTSQVTRYLRDLKGQVTEVIDALGQREQYAYDGKGQLLSKLDKEGFLTKYAYTKQGDLSRIQYADGREVKLSYNPLRQLTEVQDWLGETKITPDALGRATAVQYPDGREVSYTYGKSGERTGITYPDGRTVSYGYDEQARLSEMREGDRVITYGYDAFGRLAEKKFPNGTESAYTYDSKGQLTELVHRDREGVSDRYTYLYDLTGNKTGITKERRGLEAESGAYAYGYDALGRLSQIQKDGKLQTRYGYDAFGNRVLKEDRAGRTTYRHNALNQLITEIREEGSAETALWKVYQYDKRGNLTRITENGQMTQQYVYGALNRLEEAVNGAGKAAKYQYNGLGHRVGKLEGRLPADQTGKLDPQSRIDREIGNLTQIHYTIDLTREYHNLLEKTEGEKRQTYFWDGNVASYEENGKQSYYLQDELGSPLRIADESGTIRESYGYGAFGEDLYGNQGGMQPFGYTGYQRDKVAGTYYAQKREYQTDIGKFVEQDLIMGTMGIPISMNRYNYCFDSPLILVDMNGSWPQWIEDIKNTANAGIEKLKDVWHRIDESVIHKYIIGNDITVYKTNLYGGTYEVTAHEGGNIFVFKMNGELEKTGWTLNFGGIIPNLNLSLSGQNLDISTWKLISGVQYTNANTGISVSGGSYIDKTGLAIQTGASGTSGNMPFELPDGIVVTNYAKLNWSYTLESHIMNWKQMGEGVLSLAAIIGIILFIADNAFGIGVVDDWALVPLFGYVASKFPALGEILQSLFPKLAEMCFA